MYTKCHTKGLGRQDSGRNSRGGKNKHPRVKNSCISLGCGNFSWQFCEAPLRPPLGRSSPATAGDERERKRARTFPNPMIGSRRRRRTHPFCTILHFLPLEPLARPRPLVGDREENCSIAAAAVEPPLNACRPSGSSDATSKRKRERRIDHGEFRGFFAPPFSIAGLPIQLESLGR